MMAMAMAIADGDFMTRAAPATVERRLFVGSSLDVTPEMVAQLDLGDRSVKSGLILAVTVACIILNVLFVTIRLLVRRLMTRHFFLDDTLVSIAAFFTVSLCGFCLLALPHGFGQHIWNLNPTTVLVDIKKTVQLMFLANIFYACAVTFTKLSIIVSYLRIFPYRTVHIAMYITAAITLGLFVASVPATIFQCTPVSAAWDFSSRNSQGGAAKCFVFVNFLYATTAVNVTTDLVLCTVPLPYFWNLQLHRRQKVVVSGLFFIGGFACVASIVRLTVLHNLGTSVDVTWHLGPSVLWTIAECTIGICCVSVPALRPLLGSLLPDGFLTRRVTTSAGGGGVPAAGTDVRRRAYAMGGWLADSNPGGRDGGEMKIKIPAVDDEEAMRTGTSSQASTLTADGEEQTPVSWFDMAGDENTRRYYGNREGTTGLTVVTACDDAGQEGEKSERVVGKG